MFAVVRKQSVWFFSSLLFRFVVRHEREGAPLLLRLSCGTAGWVACGMVRMTMMRVKRSLVYDQENHKECQGSTNIGHQGKQGGNLRR